MESKIGRIACVALIALVFLFLLTGCSLFGGPRPIAVVPKEVGIAVPGKCIDSKDVPQAPQFPLDTVDLSRDVPLSRLTNAARLERKARIEYVGKVQEALKKCSD